MENKPKLSVVAYDAQQEGFNAALEMNVRFLVRGVKPTDSSKYIDGILMAIQKLDIEKYHKPNIVKSEEDISCHGEQIEKNVRLDLDKIKFGPVGTRRIDLSNITGIEVVKNDTQNVMFNGKRIATASDKGIDLHVPIVIDGVEIAKYTVDELRSIEFKGTRTRGVV